MEPFNLNDNYRVVTDERSWVLERRSVVKKSKDPGLVGTETWKPVGWYPHLHLLVTAAAQRLAHESGDALPEGIFDACNRLKGLVEHARREMEGRHPSS